MSMGKPQVVSDSTAQAKLIIELKCGLVHKAEDFKDLAEKIQKLYQEPQLAKEMGVLGQKAVCMTYNWSNTSKPLVEIISVLNAIK